MATQEIAVIQKPQPPSVQFSGEQVELVKRTIAKGATNDELSLFMAQCQRTGLDPFARQIFAVKRWDSREGREVMQTQTSIDGFRLIAERTGKYEGQLGPFWCGPDGAWRDVWLSDNPPAAAKVGALKAGSKEPYWGVARYGAYVQFKKGGEPNSMWSKMPDVMIAKCAEALALRKAFPQELSGLYTSDEMGQADNEHDPIAAQKAVAERKIAELKAKQPQPAVGMHLEAGDAQAAAAAPALAEKKPWSTFKGMLKCFADMKDRCGTYTNIYYNVLKEFGVEHANALTSANVAWDCYRKLRAKVEEFEQINQDLKAAMEEPTAFQATDEDLPEGLFEPTPTAYGENA